MQQTTAKQFRAELKDYLELAAQEPIRIQRRSGESFILLQENLYSEMKDEIISLQKRLLGMSEIIDRKVTEYKPGTNSRLKRFKKDA